MAKGQTEKSGSSPDAAGSICSEAFLDALERLATVGDGASLREEICRLLASLLSATSVRLFRYAPPGSPLELLAWASVNGSGRVPQVIHENRLVRQAAQEGRLVSCRATGAADDAEGEEERETLAIPLRCSGNCLGILEAGGLRPEPARRAGERRQIVQVFATHAARAMDSLARAEEAERKLQRMEALQRAMALIQEQERGEDVTPEMLEALTAVVPAEGIAFWMEHPGEGVQCIAQHGLSAECLSAIEARTKGETGSSRLRALLEREESAASGATGERLASGSLWEILAHHELNGTLAIPLTAGGGVDALLVFSRRETGDFSREDTYFAQLIADAITSLLSRARARQRLQDALETVEHQHAQLQAVFSSLPDGLIITDTQGNPSLWNPVVRRLARNPLVVDGGLDALIAQHRLRDSRGRPLDPEQSPLMRAVRGERSAGCTLLLETGDGKTMRAECRFAPVHMPDGSISGALVILRDITGAQERAVQLQLHRRMLQTALDGVAGLVVVYDVESLRPVVANQRAQQSILSACSGGDGGAPFGPAWHILKERVREAASTGIAARGRECGRRAADGDTRFWDWQVIPLGDPSGKVTHLWVGAQDVTDEVRDREQRATEHALLQAVFDNAPIGLIVRELPGMDCVHANASASQLLGAHATKEIPRATRYPQDSSGICFASAYDLVARTGEPFCARGIRVPFEDDLAWLDVDIVPIHGDKGKTTHLLLLARDVTEQVDARRQLQQAVRELERVNAQLYEASAAKDRFLAVLSHELRNPLAPIQAGVEVLRRALPTSEARVQRTLDIMQRNVQLQARLINDLLDLSRITRGKIDLKKAPVCLGTLVAGVVQSAGPQLRQKPVEMRVETDPSLWVSGDPDRLQQMVLNLLSNALKFTAMGCIRVATYREGENACVAVEDTGIGIAAEDLPRLFDMFHQGEEDGQRQPGLGVGLPMVKMLAEMHGGSVRAESAGPGQGSRFTLVLPALPVPQGKNDRAGGAEADKAGEQVRIVLVEDNPDMREMLAESLSMMGFAVRAAGSGEEALSLLERAMPDVLLSDIGLPGIDGIELMRRVRRLPEAQSLVAFAITGLGQEEVVQQAHAAGFNLHFTKPVDVSMLEARIRAAVAPLRK